MKIIIEGADSLGKTTLCKKLLNKLKIKTYAHYTSKDPRNYSFYYNTLKKENFIYDRHFISETVYSNILDRPEKLTHEQIIKLLKLVEDANIHIIILVGTPYKFKKDELDIIKNKHKIINDEFERVGKKYGLDIVNINNRGIFRRVLKLIKRRKQNEI